VHAAAAPLRDALGRGVAWVAEPALHVTIKFLGDRDQPFVDRLAATLAPRLRPLAPTVLRLGTVGAFPSLDRPRVLWLGVASNPTLARLYQEVEAACAALEVPREQRAFHPHVTLGRVRDGARVDGKALSRAAAGVAFRAESRVDSVDVMESTLGRSGARYRVAAPVPLGGDEEG
jgi:2'-5' RNA ligase